jgi:hypothetical protein
MRRHACTLNCPNQVTDTLFFDWAKAGLNLDKNDKNVLILMTNRSGQNLPKSSPNTV